MLKEDETHVVIGEALAAVCTGVVSSETYSSSSSSSPSSSSSAVDAKHSLAVSKKRTFQQQTKGVSGSSSGNDGADVASALAASGANLRTLVQVHDAMIFSLKK